jgi:hypothetical protein
MVHENFNLKNNNSVSQIPFEKKEVSSVNPKAYNDAIIQIKAFEFQVQQEGNVDSEIDAFEGIIQSLTLKQISPEQALLDAQRIIDKRQNYH